MLRLLTKQSRPTILSRRRIMGLPDISDLKKKSSQAIYDVGGKAMDFSNDAANMSTDAALTRAISTIKAADEKMKKEGLTGFQLSVSVALGPVTISISGQVIE